MKNKNKGNKITKGKDITDLKKVEEDLRKSEEKFQAYIERSPTGIFIVDEEGNYRDCNRSAHELLGYTREELLKKSIPDITPEDDAEKGVQSFLTLKEKGYIKVEVKLLREDRTTVPVILEAVRLPNNMFIAYCTNITEHKKMEESLYASHQVIEGIINAIPVRVFWKDRNLVFLGCNTIFAKDAGFTDPKDIIGKDDFQMVWRDQAELYRRDDRQVIESGCAKLNIEEPQTTPEGNIITLLTSKIPLRNFKGDIDGVLGTYMDITERKKAGEEMLKAREQLSALASHLQTIREEEKRKVARELHDDLGQKLTVIKIDVANLSSNLGVNKKHTKNILSLIDDSIDSVQHITKTLRPPILDDLGLVPALKWLLKDFKTHTSIDYYLTINADEIVVAPKVSLSVFRIVQEVLTNIARHSKATSVDFLITKQNENLFISIEDNGIGISEENINRPDAFGIIGIKERVMFCNGSINISGTKKAGTKIEIKIPIEEIKND